MENTPDLARFAVTFDYRCPFARNAHEHLIEGLVAGAEWEVTFVPFSLTQSHVPEGGTPVWDDPTKAPDLIALAAGVVVRDEFPDQFLDLHRALFAARHDDGRDLRDPAVVRSVLEANGLPAAEVMERIESGGALAQLRAEHDRAVTQHKVFGVPTFIVGDRAVFVRLMTRPEGDAKKAVTTIEQFLRVVSDQPEINELKYTTIER